MTYPKGALVAIGGAEDKGETEKEEKEQKDLNFQKLGILQSIVSLIRDRNKVIEVITTAGSLPEETFQQYKKAFRKLGVAQVGHFNITDRDLAEDKKIIQRAEKCSAVMITGGDQLRLCSILGGTRLIDIMKERYEKEHFVIAGTSAGAAAMSNTMISGGEVEKSYFKGGVHLSLGFGFLHEVIIDTHFDKRGRFGRLAQAIAAQPGAIGVGLGEDTGVVIEKGSKFHAIGSSSVTVVDGSKVHFNNIADIKEGMPISLAHLTVHIMAHSDVYDLHTREFSSHKFKTHEK